MDQAVKELISTPMADGYLGTYEQKDLRTSWGVWCHKYNLIERGKYVTGRTDGSEFGVSELGLADDHVVPDIDDGYNTLVWWGYEDIAVKKDDVVRNYPYISWARDHYWGGMSNPISNRDYPLTWEIKASAADYPGMALVDERYVKEKNATAMETSISPAISREEMATIGMRIPARKQTGRFILSSA